MAKGQKTGGRTKGTPNKMTTIAKEAIELAADGIGGVERMIAWAKEDPANERVFWSQMYTKLLPLQLAGDADNPLTITQIVHTIVDPEHSDS